MTDPWAWQRRYPNVAFLLAVAVVVAGVGAGVVVIGALARVAWWLFVQGWTLS